MDDGRLGTAAPTPQARLDHLPRLLYVGDVPVEHSVSGSALLYRLLEGYPPQRLVVVQSPHVEKAPDRRLAGVRYEIYRLPLQRLMSTRLADKASLWRYWTARRRWRTIARAARGFDAQAVLTVAHGWSWITAAQLARARGLPLHLIVHDSMPDNMGIARSWYPRVCQTFEAIWRQASSRLCVSPQMAEAYALPEAPGQVLYPSRARGAAAFTHPPPPAAPAAPLRFGFAGTINSPGLIQLLLTLAEALEPMDAKLVLFSGGYVTQALLARRNVQAREFVASELLAEELRQAVDVLFLPMSFAPRDRTNQTLGFPSKLTEYTAACLPLLVCGPAYCSAARWARENPGVAELVETQDRAALGTALSLLADADHRARLALRAAEVGSAMFSYEAVHAKFVAALSAGVAGAIR